MEELIRFIDGTTQNQPRGNLGFFIFWEDEQAEEALHVFGDEVENLLVVFVVVVSLGE